MAISLISILKIVLLNGLAWPAHFRINYKEVSLYIVHIHVRNPVLKLKVWDIVSVRNVASYWNQIVVDISCVSCAMEAMLSRELHDVSIGS